MILKMVLFMFILLRLFPVLYFVLPNIQIVHCILRCALAIPYTILNIMNFIQNLDAYRIEILLPIVCILCSVSAGRMKFIAY